MDIKTNELSMISKIRSTSELKTLRLHRVLFFLKKSCLRSNLVFRGLILNLFSSVNGAKNRNDFVSKRFIPKLHSIFQQNIKVTY